MTFYDIHTDRLETKTDLFISFQASKRRREMKKRDHEYKVSRISSLRAFKMNKLDEDDPTRQECDNEFAFRQLCWQYANFFI